MPALLGVSYPQMASVLAYDWFYGNSVEKQSYAFALLFIITVVMATVALISFKLISHKRWLMSKGYYNR